MGILAGVGEDRRVGGALAGQEVRFCHQRLFVQEVQADGVRLRIRGLDSAVSSKERHIIGR